MEHSCHTDLTHLTRHTSGTACMNLSAGLWISIHRLSSLVFCTTSLLCCLYPSSSCSCDVFSSRPTWKWHVCPLGRCSSLVEILGRDFTSPWKGSCNHPPPMSWPFRISVHEATTNVPAMSLMGLFCCCSLGIHSKALTCFTGVKQHVMDRRSGIKSNILYNWFSSFYAFNPPNPSNGSVLTLSVFLGSVFAQDTSCMDTGGREPVTLWFQRCF